jgi:hypothetical protein
MIVHFMEIGSFLHVATVSIYDLFQKAAACICPVLTGNHSDSKSDLGTTDERNRFVENRTPLTTPINYISGSVICPLLLDNFIDE